MFCSLLPQAWGQGATLLPPRAWVVFQGIPPSAMSLCRCPELSFHASRSVDGTVHDYMVRGLFLYTKLHKEKGPNCALMSRRAQYPMFGSQTSSSKFNSKSWSLEVFFSHSMLKVLSACCTTLVLRSLRCCRNYFAASTKWVSQPEMSRRLRRWTELMVKQMVWLHGPAHETHSGSRLANPRELDACKDGRVVHGRRMQASWHNMCKREVQMFTSRRT